MADKERTHGRHVVDTLWKKEGGTQEADKVWRRGQIGHVADAGGHKADNGGPMADKLRGRGQSISRPAFFPRRENGHKVDKVWRRGQAHSRQTGGHTADTVWRRGPRRTMADPWRTSSGDAARAYRGQPFFLEERTGIRWTRFGGAAKRTQGTQADTVWRRGARRTMADTWRTSSGDGARAYRGQPFFL